MPLKPWTDGLCDSREERAASPPSSLVFFLILSFTMSGAWGLDEETEASRKPRDEYVDLGRQQCDG